MSLCVSVEGHTKVHMHYEHMLYACLCGHMAWSFVCMCALAPGHVCRVQEQACVCTQVSTHNFQSVQEHRDAQLGAGQWVDRSEEAYIYVLVSV